MIEYIEKESIVCVCKSFFYVFFTIISSVSIVSQTGEEQGTTSSSKKKRRRRRHRHRRTRTTMEEEANNLAKSRRWRKQRKKKENSIPTSPTNASMESSDVLIQHPTKPHAHPNTIVSNPPSTIHKMMMDDNDNDALEWFFQLPSGNDRAIAMAISDVAFIRTFIELSNTKVTRDIVLKQHSHCSSTNTNNTTANNHNKSDSHIRSGKSYIHTLVSVSFTDTERERERPVVEF